MGLHLLWSVLEGGEKESLKEPDPGSRGEYLDVVQILQLLGIFRWGLGGMEGFKGPWLNWGNSDALCCLVE